ncbi:MAG: AmmeMemoRadiSam system protein A [Treponema sp.]|jgi:AmmeMemoRadiSam system protein A|nr:AmmeMemoRadiSam system protein A [Treponema sp.]
MKFIITDKEKKILLSDAREIILAKLEKRSPCYEQRAAGSALSQKCGAFVTLHEKSDSGQKLRGCIGRMASDDPLEETTRNMALAAAFGDPRFPPLTKKEWPFCVIEISALSPMELCDDPHSIQVGVHGLYLVNHGRSGVLLPQVPVEQGWNLEQYLDYICEKAGLPPESYNDTSARLYTFTAEVFSETA